MSNISTRAYVHIGAVVLGALGIILPISSVYGYGLSIFESYSTIGVAIYFISVALIGAGAFLAYQSKSSKLYGILGGLGMGFMVLMNYLALEFNMWDSELGIGHWAMVLAALLSFVGGFLKDPVMQ